MTCSLLPLFSALLLLFPSYAETANKRPEVNGSGLQTISAVTYVDGLDHGQVPDARGPPTDVLVATTTDALARVSRRFQDALGRVVAVDEPTVENPGEGDIRARPLTTYAFNPLGELLEVEDARGNRTVTAYDMGGRRLSLDNPDTGPTVWTYDAAGNLTSFQDAALKAQNGKPAVRYAYDFNRLVGVSYPSSPDVAYTYGATGNETGRVVRVVDEAGYEEFEYGRLGEVTRRRRTFHPLEPGDVARTLEVAFDFDDYGRLLSLTYPDGEVLRYAYDAGGRVKRAEGEPASGGTRVYVSGLTYDTFGARKRLTLGNGVVTTYGYEEDTRRLKTLTTVAPRGSHFLQALTYTYDPVGNVTELVDALGNSSGMKELGETTYRYGYDGRDRLITADGEAVVRGGVTDVFEAKYQYDDIHRMRGRDVMRTLTRGNQTQVHRDSHAWTYAYDEDAGPHRAVAIGPQLIGYDESGRTVIECRARPANETGAVVDDGIGGGGTDGTEPAPDEALPCLGMPGPHGPTSSLTHVLGRRMTWTEDGRLRSVLGSGNSQTRFLYDASGERVAKLGRHGTQLTVGPYLTATGKHLLSKHVWLGESRLVSVLAATGEAAEGSDGSGGDVTGGVPGKGTPSLEGCLPSGGRARKCPTVEAVGFGADMGGADLFFYHPNHLSSVSVLTDADGRMLEAVAYYPYGQVWREVRAGKTKGADGKFGPRYLFTGKEYDAETGLTYFGARYYDSRTARWVSPEPDLRIFFPSRSGGGLPAGGVFRAVNLSVYAYAHLNPVVLVDRDGRFTSPLYTDRPELRSHQFGRYDPRSNDYGRVREGGRRAHQGLDLRAELNSGTRAVGPGRVVWIKQQSDEWGKWIVYSFTYTYSKSEEASDRERYGDAIANRRVEMRGQTFWALHAHLNWIDSSLRVGSELEEGQLIGSTGYSGNADALSRGEWHLHFETWNERFPSYPKEPLQGRLHPGKFLNYDARPSDNRMEYKWQFNRWKRPGSCSEP